MKYFLCFLICFSGLSNLYGSYDDIEKEIELNIKECLVYSTYFDCSMPCYWFLAGKIDGLSISLKMLESERELLYEN